MVVSDGATFAPPRFAVVTRESFYRETVCLTFVGLFGLRVGKGFLHIRFRNNCMVLYGSPGKFLRSVKRESTICTYLKRLSATCKMMHGLVL